MSAGGCFGFRCRSSRPVTTSTTRAQPRRLVRDLPLQPDAGADVERHREASRDPHEVREVRKEAAEFIEHAAHGAAFVGGGVPQAPAAAGAAAR
jgi:hypothetical protein